MIWLMVGLAMFGAVLNAAGHPEWMAWVMTVWVVSNTGLMLHNLRIRQWAQAALFGGYLIITIYGLSQWIKWA